ncbi:MAG: glycosyltransferase N-terminal domain-containing protein [Porphyromonadaceae bacterium]|nr:glycosyltransferase N-terminal domain-containing protein [Porphyromonadaceae bacterium]
MKTLFSLTGFLTHLGMRLAALWHPKAKQIIDGRREIAERIKHGINPCGKTVWFHAASLGEFEQGRPLMEELRRRDPACQILVSFFSPSGYNVRHSYSGANAVVYLPADYAHAVDEFLDLARPDVAIFIKYDIWPTMLSTLNRRNIPTYLVSANFRPNQFFFHPLGRWYLSLLKMFTHIFVQEGESKYLLQAHGIGNVSITGDTRFDRVVDIAAQAKDIAAAAAFREAGGTILVAGSTWPLDEDILIDYFNRTPRLRLVIAPHEIDQAHLESIEAKLKRPYRRYSQLQTSTLASAEAQPDCLIIDCFGLLSSIYRYGDIAYIGGGFGRSIHNSLEAAVYGIPVLFGPKIDKFVEAKELVACSGARVVHDGRELADALDHLLSSEQARKHAGNAAGGYVRSKTGATDKVLTEIGYQKMQKTK